MAFMTRFKMTCCNWTLIAFYGRKLIVELHLKFYAVFLQIDPYDRQNRQDEVVDVDSAALVRLLSEHRTNARDDIASAMTGFHNLCQRASAL